MSLSPLVGHWSERRLVGRALATGRLPQVLLLTGPQGVGKQRFGIWIAQAVFCEGAGEPPCGECRPCQQMAALSHPDFHWFIPVPRPKAADQDKQLDELAETVAGVVEARRRNPFYPPPEGLEGHFVSTARLIQRRAAMTPAVARRKVFLVAEADRLVPQEASPEAANTLLKLFEEPPEDCLFILTVVDPNRLLSTLRSRAVLLRLGRLPDREVEAFLRANLSLEPNELQQRVAAAQGSIGRALATGADGAKSVRAAEELLRAIIDGTAARAERALKQGPWQARGDFTAMLDSLAVLLSDAGRAASGVPMPRTLPEVLTRPREPSALVSAQSRVASAREAAQGNVNPQLLLAALGDDLAEIL